MESFEQTVARVSMNSFIDHTVAKKLRVPKKNQRVQRLLNRIRESMDERQTALLVLVLEGRAALIVVDGRSYAVRASNDVWVVEGLGKGGRQHTVYKDARGCSCEDNRFRQRRCKHMVAVEESLK